MFRGFTSNRRSAFRHRLTLPDLQDLGNNVVAILLRKSRRERSRAGNLDI